MRSEARGAVRWLAALLVAAPLAIAASSSEASLRLELEEVRSYSLPSLFAIEDSIVRSKPSGPTLVANTTGSGERTTCTVVLVSQTSARSYRYRLSSGGTHCVNALVHPDGGFIVRGTRAGAAEDEVSGFAARVGEDGTERWLLHDTAIEASSGFRGDYETPAAAMAYSAERERLLEFTVGRLEIGDLGEKRVTHASVVEGGQLRIEAKQLGSTGGVGEIAAATTLPETGDFLVHVRDRVTDDVQFFTYDGRETVDAFKPLGEDWDGRTVRQMRRGPEGAIYLVWTEQDRGEIPTHVTAVDAEAAEIWSREYPASLSEGEGSMGLGVPNRMWVGAEHVVVLYDVGGAFLRVIDRESGESVGTGRLAGRTEDQLLDLIHGPEGRLRLLAVDPSSNRFREYRLGFSDAAGGDVGVSDAAFDDIGGDAANGGGGGGNGSGCGLCSKSSGGRSPPPGSTVWLLVVGTLLLGARRI